jgi:CRP/FNR family transcriptional regulator, cyclic AMP receptor protein
MSNQELDSFCAFLSQGFACRLAKYSAAMNTIANHPFLHGISPEHIALIEEGAKHLEYEVDELLTKEDQPANRFFLIESGLVAVEAQGADHKPTVIETIGNGEPLGWSWLFPPFTWHFRARAVKTTSAIVLDGGRLLVLCEENHELGYELMRRVTQIVVSRLQATQKRLAS